MTSLKKSEVYFLISITALVFSLPGDAAQVDMEFPVSCDLNKNCWIVNYDEKGTKIFIKSFKEMEKGVSVLSAEYGTVIYVQKDPENKTQTGNSVIIQHNNGWKTIYSHLKNDSIQVGRGDFVSKKGKIAEIGRSGKVEIPQLHFTAFKDGEFHLPPWSPLIEEEIESSDFVIANMGIAAEEPELQKLRLGSYDSTELLNNTSAIYIWVYGFKFKKGDFLKFSLNGPESEKLINQVLQVDKDYRENFYSVKKIAADRAFNPGAYMTKIEFIRPDAGIAKEYVFSFNVKEPEKPVDPEVLKKQKEQEELERARFIRRRQILFYKKLYDEGKLPDTVPEHVKERLK